MTAPPPIVSFAPVTLATYRSLAAPPRQSLQSRVRVAPDCYPALYHGPERETDSITLIVMHCTAGNSALESIAWLNRPDSDNKASYHYVIERDGTIYRMVPASVIAYHAGDSAWPNPKLYPPGNVYLDEDGDTHHHTVNARSLGIAWANRNDGSEPLTRAQVESALWLCGVYVPTTGVKSADNIVGHLEVSPKRKTDPLPAVMPMDMFRDLVRLYLRSEG